MTWEWYFYNDGSYPLIYSYVRLFNRSDIVLLLRMTGAPVERDISFDPETGPSVVES